MNPTGYAPIPPTRPKKEVRKEYRVILENLDKRWLNAASQRLCRNLVQFFNQPSQQSINHILCFSAFFPGEINLSTFISQVISKKQVYLPRCSPDGTMKFISLGNDWLQQTSSGLYGIKEPESGNVFVCTEPTKSAIIVPGLAFDKLGNRLGRGKGYYDRFLSMREHRSIMTIGVCWDLQILESVPTDSHDIMLQWLISEEQTLFTGLEMDAD
jgi:5-formyltetrahydrofolate cyclo-ligase